MFIVFCKSKFNICVRCDMAFIEPMHRNKPNITYLLTSIGNPIMEIRRSYNRVISALGFTILERLHLYIESGPMTVMGLLLLDIIMIMSWFLFINFTCMHWWCFIFVVDTASLLSKCLQTPWDISCSFVMVYSSPPSCLTLTWSSAKRSLITSPAMSGEKSDMGV